MRKWAQRVSETPPSLTPLPQHIRQNGALTWSLDFTGLHFFPLDKSSHSLLSVLRRGSRGCFLQNLQAQQLRLILGTVLGTHIPRLPAAQLCPPPLAGLPNVRGVPGLPLPSPPLSIPGSPDGARLYFNLLLLLLPTCWGPPQTSPYFKQMLLHCSGSCLILFSLFTC